MHGGAVTNTGSAVSLTLGPSVLLGTEAWNPVTGAKPGLYVRRPGVVTDRDGVPRKL